MLCLLASALLPAALAQGWSNDGGNTFRTNFMSLEFPVFTGTPVPHITSTYSEPEEDTVSMVEEQLLQSPLVTSDGSGIVVQTDSCVIALLPDPSQDPSWPATLATWSPPALSDECEAGGIALDTDNTIYFLDSRNRVVYALLLSIAPNPFITLKWTANYPLLNSKSIFPLDASLLVVSSASQLWVPLKFSLLRPSDGIAWVIDTDTGATNMTVPLPEMGCSNEDNGNALVNLPGSAVGLAQLSSDDCGLPLFSTGSDYVRYPTGPEFDNMPFGFEMGQHSHPVYDTGLNQLYYFDFLGSVFEGPQLLCCWDTVQGKACSGWNFPLAPKSGCVTELPVLSTEDGGNVTYRYSWIAGGLLATSNLLFVVTSGPVDEDVLMRSGFQSTLSAVDTTTGLIASTYTTSADFYNSAPLVVSGSDGGSIVIVSTSDGSLVAFAATADGPLEEPLWRSQDLPGIPAEDLPACTYAFLSVTPAGTILATTSAGGAVWQDEKAYSAVANGVFPPGAPASPSPSPTAGASASPTNTATATATAAPGSATGTRTATPTPSRTRTPTSTSSLIIYSAVFSFPPPTPAAGGGGGSNAAPATGLSPGAAAGVSLLVIALAAGGGLYIFAAYFGGGPALAAAWASIAGVGGGGGGAAPTSGALRVTVPSSGAGEKMGLLSTKAAQDRFAAQ